MVDHLGLPTLFITFTLAAYQWPAYHQLIIKQAKEYKYHTRSKEMLAKYSDS